MRRATPATAEGRRAEQSHPSEDGHNHSVVAESPLPAADSSSDEDCGGQSDHADCFIPCAPRRALMPKPICRNQPLGPVPIGLEPTGWAHPGHGSETPARWSRSVCVEAAAKRFPKSATVTNAVSTPSMDITCPCNQHHAQTSTCQSQVRIAKATGQFQKAHRRGAVAICKRGCPQPQATGARVPVWPVKSSLAGRPHASAVLWL